MKTLLGKIISAITIAVLLETAVVLILFSVPFIFIPVIGTKAFEFLITKASAVLEAAETVGG